MNILLILTDKPARACWAMAGRPLPEEAGGLDGGRFFRQFRRALAKLILLSRRW